MKWTKLVRKFNNNFKTNLQDLPDPEHLNELSCRLGRNWGTFCLASSWLLPHTKFNPRYTSIQLQWLITSIYQRKSWVRCYESLTLYCIFSPVSEGFVRGPIVEFPKSFACLARVIWRLCCPWYLSRISQNLAHVRHPTNRWDLNICSLFARYSSRNHTYPHNFNRNNHRPSNYNNHNFLILIRERTLIESIGSFRYANFRW